jgi:hypothetical protein
MNVTFFYKKGYENMSNWAKRTQSKPILAKKCKNKPNSNPIYSELARPERSRMGRTYFKGKKTCCLLKQN